MDFDLPAVSFAFTLGTDLDATKDLELENPFSSQGVASDFGPFSEPSHEVTLGLKAEISPRTVLEIGLIENILVSDNSPDFGLHVGLAVRS